MQASEVVNLKPISSSFTRAVPFFNAVETLLTVVYACLSKLIANMPASEVVNLKPISSSFTRAVPFFSAVETLLTVVYACLSK
ncbi:hypothetical protein MTO96_003796 [Rhipicephalus appendiculatus]